MAKSIKLKDNNYWDTSSIVRKGNTLENWLSGRVYKTEKLLGKINEYFNSQRGYKEVSIDIPPKTVYVIIGLATGQVSGIAGIQVTGLYNSIAVNNSNATQTYSYWFNYLYPSSISTNTGNVSLDILAIKL